MHGRQKHPMMAASVGILAAAALLLRPLLAGDPDVYTADERSHWSLQPRSTPAIPLPASGDLRAALASPIDAFIVARLERADLHPPPPVARRTLVRRLYFNLLGLPPTPAAIESFLSD